MVPWSQMSSAQRRLLRGIRIGDGCWEWQKGKTSHGYGTIRTSQKTVGMAHKISWELYRGAVPPGFYVCHSCDNPACVRPDHLFLGTQKDNMQDCSRKGRLASGPRNGNWKHGKCSLARTG